MKSREQAAAKWWADALANSSAYSSASNQISRRRLQKFRAALEQEIRAMLRDGLPPVLTTNRPFVCDTLSRAAAACGIEDIGSHLPDQVIMRIFADTVMVHRGPYALLEIVWSADTNKRHEAGTRREPYRRELTSKKQPLAVAA